MKIRCTEQQGYYNLSDMALTSGKVYTVVEHIHSMIKVVINDRGGKTWLAQNEYDVVSELEE